MKNIKKMVFIILFISIIWLLTNMSMAGSQTLNNLKYDIEIMDNGNVMITEYWDIDMYDTNTLFKTFRKDSKFKEVTEVSVIEEDALHNPISTFLNSREYKYHEEKGYFHATDDEDGNFEIAWGVSTEEREHRHFKISYIIKDCINVYDDCAEFYWKVIGEEWQIETDHVDGIVTLPSDVEVYEDFRVWAHGPLTGVIMKDDNKTCSFSVDQMPTKTFLELRIVFPSEVISHAQNINNKEMLDTILKEEQKNADRANMIRKVSQSKEKIMAAAISFITCIFGINAISRIKKIGEKYKSASKNQGSYKYDYFRDIPDDKMSPVTAAVLENETISKKNSFSSLMMSLTQKKWISIFPGEKKDDTIIKLNIDDDVETSGQNIDDSEIKSKDESAVVVGKKEDLTDDEQRTLNYLGRVGKKFSLKDFEKYTNKHQESFYNFVNSLEGIAQDELRNIYEYTDRKNEDLKFDLETMTMTSFGMAMLTATIVGTTALGFLSKKTIRYVLGFMAVVIIVYIFGAVKAGICNKKITRYTDKGADERAKWKGLKKFMEDFSLINEREIPELVLWEKYLVYATAFGIADKVIKQLKTRFPELNDDTYISSNYSCLYMASHSNIYSSSFNKSVSAAEAYHAREVASSSYSSGSGGGGGFSSGGGGGRRWRWPEAVDKPNFVLKGTFDWIGAFDRIGTDHFRTFLKMSENDLSLSGQMPLSSQMSLLGQNDLSSLEQKLVSDRYKFFLRKRFLWILFWNFD